MILAVLYSYPYVVFSYHESGLVHVKTEYDGGYSGRFLRVIVKDLQLCFVSGIARLWEASSHLMKTLQQLCGRLTRGGLRPSPISSTTLPAM